MIWKGGEARTKMIVSCTTTCICEHDHYTLVPVCVVVCSEVDEHLLSLKII